MLKAQTESRAQRAANAGEAGFTLVEMLVVLSIIGLIVGLVGPRVLGYLGDSKLKAARIQIDSFVSALDLFYLDNGRFPTSSEGIDALMQKPANASAWTGPYLKGNGVPKDPWGRIYVYRSPSQHGPYEISSLGPDGQEGANNVTSWSR